MVGGLSALALLAIGGGGGKSSSKDPPAPPAAQLLPFTDSELTTNWGTTPTWVRPVLLQIEKVSGLPGAARFLAIVARGESSFTVTAHNQSKTEVDASRAAYDNAIDTFPPLKYASRARDFGGGGLFGSLAPYFLWAGVQGELGNQAPLLQAPPEWMFAPHVAGFDAAFRMSRLLKHYPIADWPDVRAGWRSPSLLVDGYGGATHLDRRQKFIDRAASMQIDLGQFPPPDASGYTGAAAIWKGLVAA